MQNPRKTDEAATVAGEAESAETVAQAPSQVTAGPIPPADGTRPGSDPDRTTAVEAELEPTAAGDAAALEQKILRMKAASERARVKHDPLIGQEIQGRFRITAKIGEGGMGAVYRGEQISMHRPVAVKTLLRQLVKDEKFVRRFQNEALAVSKLAHPNTIRIIDFGQLDEGTFYIVMELLVGRPLQRAFREDRTLGVRRVLHIIEQAARSLHEAHGKGIVHRDLKPDNIFLCKVDDDEDFVKVLDFGVAKMIDDSPGGRENLTQTAMILGTPKYMSPEQGMTRPVDGRSDLYALGVMAYEALIGMAPFTGEPMALLYHHVHTQPKTLGEARPDIDIPEEVEELVMQLLSKDAALRPATGDDLANACQRLRQALPARYDRAVTRDEAAQAAVIEQRRHATVLTAAHRADTVAQGQLLAPAPAASTLTSTATPAARSHRGLGWAIGAATVLVVAAGAAVAIKVSVDPLPAAYRLAVPAGALPTLELGELPVDKVTVRLESEPPGAEVRSGEEVLGNAPLTVDRLRNTASSTYAFRFDPDNAVDLQVAFGADGTFTARLPVDKPLAGAAQPPQAGTTPTDAGPDEQGASSGSAEVQAEVVEKQQGASGKKPKTPQQPKAPTNGGTAASQPPADDGRVNILK